MNKRVNSIVLTAMMVIFAFVAFSMSVSADPGVINVPSPGNETIQQAINNATAGDLILVDATAYTATETVDVNRSDIIIRSVNGRAEVKAGGASDHVFNITDQTNVTLEGFTIRDARGTGQDVAGIWMNNASDCNISNNIVTNISTTGTYDAFGIWMDAENANFTDTSISDVYGNDNAWGIRMQAINANFDPTIIKNVTAVNGDAYGIEMDVMGNANFADTSISDVYGNNSASGIEMWVAGNASFDPTIIENVTAVNGDACGIMMQAENATFNDTSISDVYGNDNAGGIRMQAINANFDPTIIKNVTAVNGDAYGIEMGVMGNANFADTSISDVYGNNSASGIEVWVAGNANFDPTIIENVTAVNGDACGIMMQAENATFNDTSISDVYGYNSASGIMMQAINANFTDTSISDVYGNDSAHGIWMYVINAVISHGEIKDNGHGIWIESSENTMITGFMIINNTEMDTGVHLTGDTNNTKIHGNCFIDNVPQAWDNGTNNNWAGNYWSDYIPPGPYLINGTANSEDSNPLPDCPIGQPDLNITDKSEDWVNATHYNVIYTVCNIGDAPAGKSNTTITIDGVGVLEDSVPALGVGECYTNTIGPFECTAPRDCN